jgi:hypothetical protein
LTRQRPLRPRSPKIPRETKVKHHLRATAKENYFGVDTERSGRFGPISRSFDSRQPQIRPHQSLHFTSNPGGFLRCESPQR